MAAMVVSVCAEPRWEFVLHSPPCRWKVAVLILVSSMCNVISLANVDGLHIVFAVVRMVAQRLHVDLFTFLHHDFGVGPTGLLGLDQLEEVFPCGCTIFGT